MQTASLTLRENYWDDFQVNSEDIDYLYTHLLEVETPLPPEELITVLVEERIKRELKALEDKKLAGGEVYLPKESYKTGQVLTFPVLEWQQGEVVGVREGTNPNVGEFSVIEVSFENGETKEFAAELEDHVLNEPVDIGGEDTPTPEDVLDTHSETLISRLQDVLEQNEEFVRIAGRWFPRALLVEVNTGHLNLAEAVLDMAGGGPAETADLIDQIELGQVEENQKLVEFSLDLALQEDNRFDEVGPAGEVLWFLNRLEPEAVRETPQYLQYEPIDYDRSLLSSEMMDLEQELDDELSPSDKSVHELDTVTIRLLLPHLLSGTLPLSPRVESLFPTAYEAPRIRFILVDGDNKEKFPGWVVREKGYVYGLRDWYESKGLMPGSYVRISRRKNLGEVVVDIDSQRSSRDWVKTALIGSDGGVVFAMLKQIVNAAYDDRMAIAIPDLDALVDAWDTMKKSSLPFERVVVNMVRELSKLNPQSHVHVAELYAAVNLIRRCPPGPIMALLESRPWFIHVGDLHYRFDDSEVTS